MAYRVLLGRKAEKGLRELSEIDRRRVRTGLLVLAEDAVRPRPGADIKPLKGTNRLFRIRVGPYRAIYGIDKSDVIVTDLFRKKRGYDV